MTSDSTKGQAGNDFVLAAGRGLKTMVPDAPTYDGLAKEIELDDAGCVANLEEDAAVLSEAAGRGGKAGSGPAISFSS